ncbi:hypothetical protein IW261DRAFT_1455618 [Armillaria novae-zelandiae]|uniref:Uncharacterized protein n=1 Tax=Armillaria novae-zelandiae TaxID=153914 RepID=A0AA39UKD1_9AGAR|nr:hypothetical protein IW261DRAFT_1455618 [Armillaria novae-zelandiae]
MISLALASSSMNVNRIDFVDCSVADICSIGSVFPNLTQMEIQNPLRSASPDNTCIPLLLSLTITLSKPHLQPLNNIFETFSLPNLISLTICASSVLLPADTLIAFLETSPGLRALTVSSCVSNLSLVIAASKNLAVLDIYVLEECLDEIFDVIGNSGRPSEAIVLRMIEKKSEDEVRVSCQEDKDFSEGSQDEESDSEDDGDESDSAEESDEEETKATYEMVSTEVIRDARLRYHHRMRTFRAAGRRIAIC